MASPQNTTTADPVCDMWGRRCGQPARFTIEATVRIGAHDEPLTWLVCDSLVCLNASNFHAERIGQHRDTRDLTDEDEIWASVEALLLSCGLPRAGKAVRPDALNGAS